MNLIKSALQGILDEVPELHDQAGFGGGFGDGEGVDVHTPGSDLGEDEDEEEEQEQEEGGNEGDTVAAGSSEEASESDSDFALVSAESKKLDVEMTADLAALQEERSKNKILQKRLRDLNTAFDKVQASAKSTHISEQDMRCRVQELEEEIDSLQDERRVLKGKWHEAEHERENLSAQLQHLQVELEKRTRVQRQDVNKLTGQLDEIERLRGELKEAAAREEALKEEMGQSASAHQRLHKLKAELEVAEGELAIAKGDIVNLRTEHESLNQALIQLQSDSEQRARVYKRKMEALNKELEKERSTVSELKQTLEQERREFVTQSQALRQQLVVSQKEAEALRKEVDDLQSDLQASRTRSFDSGAVERHQSSELDPSELREMTESDGDDKSTGDQIAACEDDGKVDRALMRKLIVTYFSQKQSGTFQAQREVLGLLASLLEMSKPDRETIGLDLPATNDRDVSIQRLFSALVFGGATEEEKNPTDWSKIEQQVAEKGFGEVFQDFLEQDL